MSNGPIDRRTCVLVVGAPRSGTTWLHRMIAAHPAIAAMPEQELTIISRYAGTWERNFIAEKQDLEAGRWQQGLPTIMSSGEFEDMLKRIVHELYARVLAKNPGATHILDKHPNYANFLHVADKYLPGCKVVHVIRDGREVAVSMMSVQRRAGHSPGEVRGAAIEWHRCVTNARAAGALLGRDRYLEVRYEELVSDTAAQLGRVFAHCGLPFTAAEVGAIATAHHISNKQVSRGDTANNALRSEPGAIWKIRLSLGERYRFDRIAGGLLLRLGHADPGWWALNPFQRIWMLPYGTLVRIKRSLLALRDIWEKPFEQRLP